MTSTSHDVPPRPSEESSEADQFPVDVDVIRETIAQAHELRDLSTATAELADVAERLRGHIGLLLPDAQAATDKLWHGSIEWSRSTGRLSGVRHQIKQGLGAGTLAAHVQVNQLARDCIWLLDKYMAQQP